MNGDIMGIGIIAFIIVLFIAASAALHLWINRYRGLVAGEYIKRGGAVCMGEDGKVYNAAGSDAPIGFIMEYKTDDKI